MTGGALTTSGRARVLAVEPDFLVVDAAGRRCCVPSLLGGEPHPGDWVLLRGGTAARRAAPPEAALDHPIDADLEDERHHYPTEDPDRRAPSRGRVTPGRSVGR